MSVSRDRAGNRRKRKEDRRANHQPLLERVQDEQIRKQPARSRKVLIEPLNAAQRSYDISMRVNVLTIGVGPAGTGKTWLAATRAAEALRDGETEKIIITRPAIEAGENLGFLPGEMNEKYEPYFRPVRDALVETLGGGALEYHLKAGAIEARPLAYMRGATFKNAWIILDEAQNTTPSQMKMFLTRIGEDSRVIVNGDLKQKDIPGRSGLEDAIERLIGKLPSAEAVFFKRSDIVRSGFCQDVLNAYEGVITDVIPDGAQLSWL